MTSLSAMILAGGHSRRMGTDKALLHLPTGQPLIERTAQIARVLTSNILVVTPWPERYEAVLSKDISLVREQPHQNGPLGGFAQGWHTIESDWCLVLACDLPLLESQPLLDWWAWLQQQERQQQALQQQERRPQAGEDALAEPSPLKAASLAHRNLAHRNLAHRNLAYRNRTRHNRTRHNRTHHKQALQQDKIWEPLCGFYHRNCLASLRDRLTNPSDQSVEVKHPRHLSFQSWLKPLPILHYDQLPEALLFNCNTAEDWAQIKRQSKI